MPQDIVAFTSVYSRGMVDPGNDFLQRSAT